jgi:hypothetical protein
LESCFEGDEQALSVEGRAEVRLEEAQVVIVELLRHNLTECFNADLIVFQRLPIKVKSEE